MSAAARRHALLDTAARIVVDHGIAAMSMERLAAESGVSKALPYKHFDNREDVLSQLYRRETTELGRAVWRALSDAPADQDAVRVGVAAYLDHFIKRSDLLAALAQPGSTVPAVADPAQAGVAFEVEVLERFHGVPRGRAKQIAGIVHGAVVGATSTLQAGHSRRSRLEADLVAMIHGLIGAEEQRV